MAIKYLDAKRIRGSSTGASSGKLAGTSGTGSVFADFGRTGNNDSISYDLGSALGSSANEWILEFKFHVDTVSYNDGSGTKWGFGMSSLPATTGYADNQDSITMNLAFSNNGSEEDIQACNGNGTEIQSNLVEIGSDLLDPTTSAGKTWFVQIKRTSDTAGTIKMGTDSYGGTANGGSATLSNLTANVTGLQYFVAKNYVASSVNNHVYGNITDVKIYDNQSSATTVTYDINEKMKSTDGWVITTPSIANIIPIETDEKTTVTDVPAGSQFEETDTRKFYQFSDGGYDSGLGSDGNWTTVTSLTNNDSVTTPSGLNSAGITKSWLSDGANTIISTSTGQLIPVDSDITFVAWVYSDVIETQCIFNSNANNYFVVYLANNGDRLEFKVQDGDGESSGGEADFPFAVDTWYMIACTFNASTGQTISYVFDTSDDSKTEVKDSGPDPIRSVATNTAWKMIGGGTETFNGRVLSPCIWNVILSSSDLDDLFDSGDGAVMNTVQKDKIVCYWDSQTGTNGTPISNLAVGKKWTERGTAI